MREILRKCSSCGDQGHNSRTCNAKSSMKLFGVTIEPGNVTDEMTKSKSMANLVSLDQPNGNDSVPSDDSGYHSDGLIHNKKRKVKHDRKKGTPWDEEEHRRFLVGLSRLGKGNWCAISRDYLPRRTPAQVASHAQKYFLRKSANDLKKRRSSLFDMPVNQDGSAESSSRSTRKSEAENPPPAGSERQSLPPENSSTVVTNNFQQLCLANYPVQVPPNPNYQPLTSQYPMGLGYVATSVHPGSEDMMRSGYVLIPNSFRLHPILPMLPSSNSSPPPAVTNNSNSKESNGNVTETQTAEKRDDLDVVTGLCLGPPTQPSTAPSSPHSSSPS